MQYVVLDPSRKAASQSDGGKEVDESMVEFRALSTGKASWTMTVAKNGTYSGSEIRFPFRQSVKTIPSRVTMLLVSLEISRSTTTPEGEPVSFTREQAFPVMIAEDSVPKNLCVVFEGAAGGMLNVGVRPNCTDSVAPTTSSRSIPAPRH